MKYFTLKSKLFGACLTALMAVGLGSSAYAQYFTLNTVPPNTGGNGYGGIAFNVTAAQTVEIDSLYMALNTTSTTLDIWYNTTAVSGAPTISTANGWVQLGSVTTSGSNVGTTISTPLQALPLELNLLMQAGETFGFYVGSTSGGNVIYQTYSGGTTTFNDGVITINTGPGVGYGGNYPNPTFSTRQFCGGVTYSFPSTAPNDAGISAILSPGSFCQGDTADLIVKLNNFGTEQLDSCMIHWNVNGTTSSAWYVVNLDTFGGGGPTDTILTLDNLVLNGPTDITVYTTLPNNATDTVNMNDTSYYVGGPSLNGTYTLGTSGSADFATFNDFIDSLNMVGVCGPVIVEVEDGSYNESITLSEVPTMDATNTVTFRGANMDATLDTLTSSSGNTVNMDGGSYFRFEHITIENTTGFNYVMYWTNGSSYNKIEDCVIRNNDSTSTSTTDALIYSGSGTMNEFNEFRNNHFKNGSYGLYWYGASSVSMEQGNVFVGNEFEDQYYFGLAVYYQRNLEFSENVIHSSSSYSFGYGTYFYYCDDSRWNANYLYTEPGSAWPYYGFNVYYSDASNFFNPGLISNNVVSVGDTTNTSTSYYAFRVYYSNIMSVVNNTSIIRGGSTSSYAMYHYGCDFGTFQNNVMYNNGGGYAYYDNYSDELIKDNNVYYTTGSNLMYNEFNTYSSLESFVTATGQDTSSFQIDPMFNNWMTGTYCNDTLDNTAAPISYVPADWSMIARSNTPDPGAHEFFGLSGVNLGPDTTLCQDEYVLTIGDSALASSVAWTVDGVTYTTPTYVVQTNGAAETFTINASVTTVCGTASDDIDVTLVPNVAFPDSIHICADETFVLDAQGGPTSTYMWFPTAEVTSTIDVSTPGVYTVTKSEEGCVSEATTLVTQSAAVAIADLEPCDANLPVSVNATIPDGVSYAWSGGASTSGVSNTFDADGDYAVSATDAFGCTSVDSFSVMIIDEPTAKIDESHVGTTYFFNSDNSEDVGSSATYFWDFGDGGNSSMANPTHNYAWSNPSAPAQYQVTLTITNECGTDTDDEIISPNVLGVNELNAETNYKVYPNPSAGLINVEFMGTTGDNVSLRVIDITGRVIATQAANTAEITTVDLNGVAAGTYILEVNLNGVVSNTRVSIK